MKRRPSQGWGFAIALSLLLHGVMGRYALDEYVREVGGRIFLSGFAREDVGMPIFLARSRSDSEVLPLPPVAEAEPMQEEKSLLDAVPPPVPERPPLFGEADGKGTFIQSTPGDTPTEARKASEDQAFASRDPVGRARPGEAPSPNVDPTGANGGGGGGRRTQAPDTPKPTLPTTNTPAERAAASPREPVPASPPERVSPPPPPPTVASKGDERKNEDAPGVVGQSGLVFVQTPATGPTTRSEQNVVLNSSGDGPVSDIERKSIERARIDPLATQPVDSPSTRPIEPTWRTKPDSTLADATTKPTDTDDPAAPKPIDVTLADEYLKPQEQAMPDVASVSSPPDSTPTVVQQSSGPGGAPGVAAPSADVAPQTDSEVDPFTKMGFITFKPGRADVKFGRKIKTTRPQLLLAGQWASVTMKKQTVQVGIRIDSTGKVTNVDIVRGSGTNDIDLPIQRAIYDWWIEPIKDRFGTVPSSDLIFLDINVVG